MSFRSPLEQLHVLDTASPKFRDQIANVLHGESYKQWVQAVQEDDLARLIDYLDEVRRRAKLIHPLLKLP